MSDTTESEPKIPTKVCRKCSVQSNTDGGFCPNCGASYAGRRRRPSRKGIVLVAAVVVLLAAGGVTYAKHQHDVRADNDRAAAAAIQTKRDAQAAQDKSDEDERASRRDLVKELEKYIEKDAKKQVKAGLLDGPIKEASCTATGGGSTDDLTALTGTFDCLAVNKEHKDGTSSGYGYAGTIDWKTSELTWQLGGP